jgi:hypothetical protein
MENNHIPEDELNLPPQEQTPISDTSDAPVLPETALSAVSGVKTPFFYQESSLEQTIRMEASMTFSSSSLHSAK